MNTCRHTALLAAIILLAGASNVLGATGKDGCTTRGNGGSIQINPKNGDMVVDSDGNILLSVREGAKVMVQTVSETGDVVVGPHEIATLKDLQALESRLTSKISTVENTVGSCAVGDWVLLASNVEWGTNNDDHGLWTPTETVCGDSVKLVHKSGGVSCRRCGPTSHFGCFETDDGPHLGAYITTGKGAEDIIAPAANDPLVTARDPAGWYKREGFTSTSNELVLQVKDSNFCFAAKTPYHLWFAEDMLDTSEDSNHGTASTDIYVRRNICPERSSVDSSLVGALEACADNVEHLNDRVAALERLTTTTTTTTTTTKTTITTTITTTTTTTKTTVTTTTTKPACTPSWQLIASDVEWGATGDDHGVWSLPTPGTTLCASKIKLVHKRGGVSCRPSGPTSHFGCYGGADIGVYVTVGKRMEHIIAPSPDDPLISGDVANGNWYYRTGFTSMSQELELALPHDNPGYCFQYGTDYHLWHAEDLRDSSQDDNIGVAWTDVYLHTMCA